MPKVGGGPGHWHGDQAEGIVSCETSVSRVSHGEFSATDSRDYRDCGITPLTCPHISVRLRGARKVLSRYLDTRRYQNADPLRRRSSPGSYGRVQLTLT
jgi:hypothetical protein